MTKWDGRAGPEECSLAEVPPAVGELVLERKSGKVVRYMGEWCGLLWVRPVGGGREVSVRPGGLGPAAGSEGRAGSVGR
ncbi:MULTISPECIES: hypothetical protein [Kitasatospora]|uniref:Uncharacterized protein n=1 Tax=Kitasatospora setae (strain ATCC 33774 / DSM 43861 / JCM 3304 / KCC A-0304 / NBRC 14216 / KM-6054) TaxID=452652 RepID=E4N793_KITSK|nr:MULTISPECIES: hypothetical protein [Kitasatospora]BAJ27074.1 hypothetical protein KSE_12410 [Kitasatospora setae KM-6054]